MQGGDNDFPSARRIGPRQLEIAFTGVSRGPDERTTATRTRSDGSAVRLWAGEGCPSLEVLMGDTRAPSDPGRAWRWKHESASQRYADRDRPGRPAVQARRQPRSRASSRGLAASGWRSCRLPPVWPVKVGRPASRQFSRVCARRCRVMAPQRSAGPSCWAWRPRCCFASGAPGRCERSMTWLSCSPPRWRRGRLAAELTESGAGSGSASQR